MRFLRVLDLEDTLQFTNHHLDGIGQFYHLRYLSIRNCVYVFNLPDSIGTLSNLQTLDIKGTPISELPTTITKLLKLQHLCTSYSISTEKENDIHIVSGKYKQTVGQPSTVRSDLEKDGISTCSFEYFYIPAIMYFGPFAPWRFVVELFRRRSELGLNMHDIFILRRAHWLFSSTGHVGGFRAPGGTGKLTSLQTLGAVNVSRGKEKVIKELSALTQLRKLGVTGINKGNRKKFWSAIAAHNQLRSLTVHGDDIDGCLGRGALNLDFGWFQILNVMLGGDLFPPEHLESLKLIGCLHKVPQRMQRLQNLSKLDLMGSRLDKVDEIETLSSLPNLAVLRLRGGAIVLEHLHFVGPSFPSLLALELNGEFSRPNLVTFEKGVMPKLELLQSKKYKEYREMKGLQFLKNLKEIRMYDKYSNDMKTELEKQYEAHPNLKNVSLKLIS